MIENIIDLLALNKYIGVSKEIDIAKGVNKMPQTFKEGWEQYKRKRAWQ